MKYSLDPELAALAPSIPALDLSDVPSMRALATKLLGSAPQYKSSRPLNVEDVTIPGYRGSPGVGARVYAPAGQSGLLPGLLYLHGGAYVMGDLAGVDNKARLIADRTGTVVMSVDYRLAPEHPYPAALDDSYAALLWMAGKQGRDRGIEGARIGVWGESAGGGLATALTLVARDREGPALAAQFLDAPAVDDRLKTHSMRNFYDTPFLRASDAPFIWKYYLGNVAKPGSPSVPVYAAPARAELIDLVGLPPAWVAAYQIDPVRDEVLNYAGSLIRAGVPTELHHYSGAFHVAHVIPGTVIGTRMIGAQMEAIWRLLHLSSV